MSNMDLGLDDYTIQTYWLSYDRWINLLNDPELGTFELFTNNPIVWSRYSLWVLLIWGLRQISWFHLSRQGKIMLRINKSIDLDIHNARSSIDLDIHNARSSIDLDIHNSRVPSCHKFIYRKNMNKNSNNKKIWKFFSYLVLLI